VKKKSAIPKRPEHWGLRLDAFRKRYGLSNYDLAGLTANRISKSTFQRLCVGEVQRRSAVLRPIVAESLRKFLHERKISPLLIEREVCAVVRDDNTAKSKEDSEPVLTQRTVLPKAAQQFFGLRRDPFTSEPRNHSEVFNTTQLDRIAGQVEDAILYQGFIAIIGDIGSGKSLLKRRVVQECLDSRGSRQILWPEFFNMERVHSGSISSFLLRKFGQSSPGDLVARAEKLKNLLASMSEEGTRVAIGFDECHRLHPNLITALKNFWELGSGGFDRYLGLVLFGQPRFEMTLRQPEFREISERLDIIHMPNLGRHAWDYVTHRVKTAGGAADKLFDRSSIDRLTEIASTPLALGNLVNAALLRAHELNERKVHKGILTTMLGSENGAEPRVRAVRARS